MKSSLRLGLGLIAVSSSFAFVACGDDDDNGGNGGDTSCSVSAGPSSLLGSVTYTATATGNGTLTQVRYTTDAGEIPVNSPTLPWSATVTNTTGFAAISGTGSASNGGSVTVGFTVTSAPGSNGQYTFQVSATRSGASGSVSQVLNIVATFNVGLSVAKAGNGYQFTATVLAGSSPVTGASVSFTVTNPQGGQKVLSATTGSGGVAKVKYSVTKNDPAGTYSVSAVATKNGLSGSGTGTFVK